ncbi:MAG: nucleoside phosphorylase [Rhodothermales bacterium]|jgi:nucleoside phosphorylase
MIAIIFATLEEAEPFVQSYKRGRFSGVAEGETVHDDDHLISVTGIGKIKGTLRTERLLRAYRPTEILHVGTCITLVESIKVGTLFSPSQVFEGDRVELSAPTYPRMPLALRFDDMATGTLVTQDHTVSGTQELTYWQRIAETSDMTGYAVAYVAATHGIPCGIVKVVSGRMGEDDPNLRKTLDQAHAKMTAFLIGHLG